MLPWIIHYICDCGRTKFHTHGLCKFGSLEIELNLPLVMEQGGLFVNLIAQSIADGQRYQSGDRVERVFNLPFYVLETDAIGGNPGERVLRVILPDKEVLYPWDNGCEDFYRVQLSDGEILRMKQILNRKGGRTIEVRQIGDT